MKMTNGFNLSQRSLNTLTGVDDRLVQVVKKAIQITNQDFLVLEGVRSKEQMMINWGKGRTIEQCAKWGIPSKYAKPSLAKVTWLNNPFASNHASGKAVDLVPYPVDWNDISKFKAISIAMKDAAKELNVNIEWGGDWQKSKDYPHFEIK